MLMPNLNASWKDLPKLSLDEALVKYRNTLDVELFDALEARQPVGRPRKFWSKVDFTETCWLWMAGTNPDGYGSTNFQGKIGGTHRLIYTIFIGDPAVLNVLHQCDTPPCIRPCHMFLGTQLDNMRDCVSKGRKRRGEQHRSAKLTEEQVRAIRRDTRSSPVIGKEYGINCAGIWRIQQKVTWKHV